MSDAWARIVCRAVAREPLTHDTWRLRLALPAGAHFPFRAGQYARLAFADLPPRDYSMANRPAAPQLEFHIRQMNDGGASAYVARRLRPGEAVGLEGPFGTAYLRQDHAGPILAVAGGSGLAPIKSIVETALAAGVTRPITLYFGVREARDLYLEDHFRALDRAHANLSFVPVLAVPGVTGARRRGTLDEVLAEDLDDVAGLKAYLAGPPPMVEAAVAVLRSRGMSEADLHADPFYSAAEMAARRRDGNAR